MNYYTDVLKKYAVFDGRARRSEYWYFALFNFIAGILVGILASILEFKQLGNIYSLAVLVPSLAVLSRRLHDTNRSFWWALLMFIPIIGWIALLIFVCQDSTAGSNQYGPNPKGVVGDVPPPPAPITSTPTVPPATTV